MRALRANTALELPRLDLADGTVEALKWLDLMLMTGDHVLRQKRQASFLPI